MIKASKLHLDRRRLSSLCSLCQRVVNVHRTPWITPLYAQTTVRGMVQASSVENIHLPVSTEHYASLSTSIQHEDVNDPTHKDGRSERETGAPTATIATKPMWLLTSDKSEQKSTTEWSMSEPVGWDYGIVRTIMNKLPGWETYTAEAAKVRSITPLSLGMHMHLWKLAHRDGSLSTEAVDSLPDEKWWRRCEAMIPGITSRGQNWARVFEIHSDEGRCRKVLEDARNGRLVEWALASFVIHFEAQITKINTLDRLLDLYEKQLLPRGNSHGNMKAWAKQAVSCLTKLAHHCHRVEPRMILRMPALARVALNSGSHENDMAAHRFRCEVFNEVLSLSLPRQRLWNTSGSYPNQYLWEAQKAVLQMATEYEPPLLMNHQSFRSVRRVLSGLPKDHIEKLTSRRQISSWPPYLAPADGFDETSVPEDNWSRSVKAGALMQEAGYAMSPEDTALDVLQGVDAKGAPTVQQRLFPARGLGQTDEWSARISATRGDREAWHVFQELRNSGTRPSEQAYASMFMKLAQRAKDLEDESLPGDRSLNYVSRLPSNFTELEKARLKPPSIAQLRKLMLEDGVALSARTFGILLGNANTLELAHQYLRDSEENPDVIELLTTLRRLTDADLSTVSIIPLSLFRNYLQVSCRIRDARHISWLGHSMNLIELRLRARPQEDASDLWRPVLKGLEQHSEGLRVSLKEHLQLLLRVMTHFARTPLLWVFHQYNKTLRKMLRARSHTLLGALEQGRLFHPIITILASENASNAGEENVAQAIAALRKGRREPSEDAQIALTHDIGASLEDTFEQLVKKEIYTQRFVGAADVDTELNALDVMMVRQDPCRAEHAYQYMLTLAFLGRAEKMAKYLEWLIKQWSQPDIINELNKLGGFPAWTDFNEVLCIFRILAEPMLNERIVEPLRTAIEESALPWRWPSEEFLDVFRNAISDETIIQLETCMQWIRHYQKRGSLPPGLWQEEQEEQEQQATQGTAISEVGQDHVKR